MHDLAPGLADFWSLSAEKLRDIRSGFPKGAGAPVTTLNGKYAPFGWTEWTQGFQIGSEILQFDATGEEEFLDSGIKQTLEHMPAHVSHFGVHDHGFNNVSTYGNLLRLMNEGKISENEWQRAYFQLALRLSGAIQGMRWTEIRDGGFIYSFNGPHSLFIDTIRTLRILYLSHFLGHSLFGENEVKISLLERALTHALTTARYSIYYGKNRDIYDVRGRTAHEAVFNTNNGSYRCPNSQQGYSGFTTWARGLSWAICGFSEQLEFLDKLQPDEFPGEYTSEEIRGVFLEAALATSDFYLENCPVDGIPYWDFGAPNLHKIEDHQNREADPRNEHEPVDSSSAAIAAQGFLRLANYLGNRDPEKAHSYKQAGLTLLDRLLQEPYLSRSPNHQGLLLHSVYHRPNAWDAVPPNEKIPSGEASMWGDYHFRELCLYLQKLIRGEEYYSFYGSLDPFANKR